jgi:hypothetical protein
MRGMTSVRRGVVEIKGKRRNCLEKGRRRDCVLQEDRTDKTPGLLLVL